MSLFTSSFGHGNDLTDFTSPCLSCGLAVVNDSISSRPRGLMDKASDFESEDCEFESRRGRYFLQHLKT